MMLEALVTWEKEVWKLWGPWTIFIYLTQGLDAGVLIVYIQPRDL